MTETTWTPTDEQVKATGQAIFQAVPVGRATWDEVARVVLTRIGPMIREQVLLEAAGPETDEPPYRVYADADGTDGNLDDVVERAFADGMRYGRWEVGAQLRAQARAEQTGADRE